MIQSQPTPCYHHIRRHIKLCKDPAALLHNYRVAKYTVKCNGSTTSLGRYPKEAIQRIYIVLLLETVSRYEAYFMTRSDNYRIVLTRRDIIHEAARMGGVKMILILLLPPSARRYKTEIPSDVVPRQTFSHHLIDTDVLLFLLIHHKSPANILSPPLNDMTTDSTFVNVSEAGGYIYPTLKDLWSVVTLKQCDVSSECDMSQSESGSFQDCCVVDAHNPLLQRSNTVGEMKSCVSTSQVAMMYVHKMCILLVSEEVWQKASALVGSFIVLDVCSKKGYGGDLINDKTTHTSYVDSNIFKLVCSYTRPVFSSVLNMDWNTVQRHIFRTWHLRELNLGLSDFVNLGGAHYGTHVLRRILECSQNTQTLNTQEYGLNVHVSEIPADACEVQPRGDLHHLIPIPWHITNVSHMMQISEDNILQKQITGESISYNDDIRNEDDTEKHNRRLSTANRTEHKRVLHTVDQLSSLYIYSETSQDLSETLVEDIPSIFDKREAFNLFKKMTDTRPQYTCPSFQQKSEEELKPIDKDALCGDGFTRYVNTWQEVTAAPFYSLRQYFRKLETGEDFLQDEKMIYEALRLGSFCDININAFCIHLAAAGFYATGDGDETRCFSCGIRHRGWQQKDNPFLVHRQIAPSCAHITGADGRNVPINPNSESHPSSCSVQSAEAPHVAGGDAGFASGANTDEVMNGPSQISERYETMSTVGQVSCDGGSKGASSSPVPLSHPDRVDADAGHTRQYRAACILRFDDAVYPHYSDNKVRMTSFQMWPEHHCMKPEELVPVGFFYAGYADCVRCFVCGVGLKTWEEGDDPWVEHVRWRSSCAYVKAIKGDVFIAQTLAGVGQKLQTERTGANIPATGAECVVRNDVGDVLEREACQRALEMGYSRDCVRQHALDILRDQGNDSLKLHVLVERILQEDLETSEAAAATTTQATSAGLPHTKSHIVLAPGEQHGRSAGLLQGDTYTGMPSGQQPVLGQIVSDGEDEGYGDTDEPTIFSTANKYQSMPTSLSDRSSIHGSRMPKVKAKNKAKEELEATEEETQQLRESSACKICLEDPANIVFLPCGHLVACAVCAPALERCPVCRTHIRGSVRVHLADMASVSSP